MVLLGMGRGTIPAADAGELGLAFPSEIREESPLPSEARSLSFLPSFSFLLGGMAALTQKPGSSSGALGAGLTFAVSVALFALGGSWLDSKLGTSPWLVLVGCLLGIFGGGLHMVHELAPEVLGWGSRRRPSKASKPPETPKSS
jgi:hypothetical protein